jgi:hypothetical protein
MGGRSQTLPERNEIWRSMYTGVTGWRSAQPDVPWWSQRYNLTAVVHRDALYVMGGASTSERKAFNDVWVYAENLAVENYYW